MVKVGWVPQSNISQRSSCMTLWKGFGLGLGLGLGLGGAMGLFPFFLWL